MEPLLFLVHRIPFPPNKGDKIRSFHTLQYLSKKYNIYLATFVDDDADWQYVNNVRSICKDVCIEAMNPFLSKIKSLSGLVSGCALTLPYYKNNKLQNWVDQTIEKHSIQKIFVFSSSMAQYVDSNDYSSKKRIIDFVDVDSDKWLQYSKKKFWPESFIYRRESRYLLEYEKKIVKDFDVSLFVSSEEAEHFSRIAGGIHNKIDYFYNGVDTEYFNPEKTYENPIDKDVYSIVFTGAMDYWANVEAVTWFAKDIFPKLRKAGKPIQFYIVGSNPDMKVQKLAQENIIVTGRVPDVRPYLAHANIVVAPLRIARGIQNKVLEAMAMQACVIATPHAVEGIQSRSANNLLVANEVFDFVAHIEKMMDCPADAKNMGVLARKYVLEKFSWENSLSKIDTFTA